MGSVKNSPLLRKLLAALAIVFGATLIATAASSAWRMHGNLTREYASKGTAIANSIASSSAETLLFRDVSTIQAMIDQYLDIQGVAYVVVMDARQEILAHTFTPTVPEEIKSLQGNENETQIREIVIRGQGDFLNVASPILVGKVGFVHVGMDLKVIRAEIMQSVLKQLAIIVVIFFLSLWAAYMLVNRIVQPLNRLTSYAKQLAESDSTPVVVADLQSVSARGDEVGQLAHAFQEMVLKVAAREDELRTAHDKVEQRVKERTLELEQANARSQEEIALRKRADAELRQTATALARSNAELEQFASVASHDLQEPLRKVQTLGDMLLEVSSPVLNSEGRDYLQRMQGAARRMQILINDLLAYSRVASKGKPYSAVDLSELARDVVSDLDARIAETGGRVEVGELPQLDADPLQMRQLLQNLLGNALKYHRSEEPPLVQIAGRNLANADRQQARGFAPAECEITVRDNGIGFEEKYLDRIFAPFQRLHGRGEYEGTGMGLAICRKIVERHGGAITARSIPGQGSTFIVTLPLHQQNERNDLP